MPEEKVPAPERVSGAGPSRLPGPSSTGRARRFWEGALEQGIRLVAISCVLVIALIFVFVFKEAGPVVYGNLTTAHATVASRVKRSRSLSASGWPKPSAGTSFSARRSPSRPVASKTRPSSARMIV